VKFQFDLGGATFLYISLGTKSQYRTWFGGWTLIDEAWNFPLDVKCAMVTHLSIFRDFSGTYTTLFLLP